VNLTGSGSPRTDQCPIRPCLFFVRPHCQSVGASDEGSKRDLHCHRVCAADDWARRSTIMKPVVPPACAAICNLRLSKRSGPVSMCRIISPAPGQRRASSAAQRLSCRFATSTQTRCAGSKKASRARARIERALLPIAIQKDIALLCSISRRAMARAECPSASCTLCRARGSIDAKRSPEARV